MGILENREVSGRSGSSSLCTVAVQLVPAVYHSSQLTIPSLLEVTISLFPYLFLLWKSPQRAYPASFKNRLKKRKTNTICFSFSSATWLLSSSGCDDVSLFVVIFIPELNVACQIGSSCLELSVAPKRINGPVVVIWLYKDKSHSLSLTLHLFLKYIWTDSHIHFVGLHKCTAMPSSMEVQNQPAASSWLVACQKVFQVCVWHIACLPNCLDQTETDYLTVW